MMLTATLLSILIGISLGLLAFFIQWINFSRFSSRGYGTIGETADRGFISIRQSRGMGRAIIFAVIYSFYGYAELGKILGLSHNTNSFISFFFFGIIIYLFLALGGLFDIVLTLEGMKKTFFALIICVLGYFGVAVFTVIFFSQDLFLFAAFTSRIVASLVINKTNHRIWNWSFVATICFSVSLGIGLIFIQ